MLYVVLAQHAAEVCPTSNSKTRAAVEKTMPEMPKLAQKHGLKILAGPTVSHEHLTVIVAEAPKMESLHEFIADSGLAQWNQVRVVPSMTVEDGLKDVDRMKLIY
jgi:hypothetical protein